MNLKKNNTGKILFQLLPLFVLFTVSLTYLVFQRQAVSYTGAACGHVDSSNSNFFRPCANTNMCIDEICVGASPDMPLSVGVCQFSGYNLTPPEGQGETWTEFNEAHPLLPSPYSCDCSGPHYRNGRCEPYLGEDADTAGMDCESGTCTEGFTPSGRFEGTGFCGVRLIPVLCTAETPVSTTQDGCCPTASAYAAGDPDCCPPPVVVETPVCGNGTVETGEACDNNAPVDTCTSGQTCNEGCECKPTPIPPNTNIPNSNVPENSNETPSEGNPTTPEPAISLPSDRIQGSGGCSLSL